MSDEMRVHALLGRLLEVAPELRLEWLTREVPAFSHLLVRLLAAVDDVSETVAGQAGHAMHFEVPAPGDGDPLIGQRVGPFRLERRLTEQGGMGTVYRGARADDVFEQEVAIKVIARGRETEAFLDRFMLERRVLGRLQHPHIVRILDGGATADGRPYLVTEWGDGVALDRYCGAHALNLRQRLALFQQVCAAVQYAHERGVIHRDLKPGNILVTPEGEPKLLDFGLAKVMAGHTEADVRRTVTGERPMTPAYASPEQVRGEPITEATDVYALGMILYEMVTGVRPYSVSSSRPTEIEQVVCDFDPEPPSHKAKARETSGSTVP